MSTARAGWFGLLASTLMLVQAGSAAGPDTSGELDLNAIINRSYQLLRNREPEMTAAEYSLYETIIPMVFEQPDYALRLLETMIADDEPESPAFEFVLANMYYMENRLVSAEARFMSAIEKYPDFIRAWFNLGVLRYSMDRYREAIPCFVKVISLGNRDAQTFELLGYSLQRSGNKLVAEMAFMQALIADPENARLIESLLRLYLDTGDLPRAESLLRQLIRLEPAKPDHHLIYARTLHETGRAMDAIIVLETASGLGVLPEDGRLFLANLLAGEGLFREAVEHYRELMAANSSLGAGPLLDYARYLVATGQYEDAQTALDGIEEPLPDGMRISLLRVRAELAFSRESWTEATRELEALLALKPLDGDSLLRLGEVYRMSGDSIRSEMVLKRAHRLDQSRYRASLHLANLAVEGGEFERGIAYLEDAMRLEPAPELREHLERLKALVSVRNPAGPLDSKGAE